MIKLFYSYRTFLTIVKYLFDIKFEKITLVYFVVFWFILVFENMEKTKKTKIM